ncbi:MAG: molybdopterin-dependent oxidoreductase [Desulfofustis sp.]|jgi:anaerobic selenocysteine-containing dehydrogenase|nr:molybdopterin-dependent oxidoreductase [Desulfofustis sp.]
MNYEQAKNVALRNGEQVVPTVCGMCGPGGPGGGCGIYAFVKDGRFVRVSGMDESPVNRGGVCAKGHAAPQWVYSPERLTHPLRRVGKKGQGRFEQISWEAAIEHIADTLARQKAKYGAESLAILSPAKRAYSEYLQRFLTVHGSPNYGHSGICVMQRAFAFMYTLGDWPRPDYEQGDLIIYWGRQPIFSGPVARPARAFLSARQRGARIVAIKPSVEPDAGMADIWVPVRPGTDAALALAMLHVVIGENLIDQAFVDTWCYGFKRLKSHVKQYTPEWARQICGVDSGQIVQLARWYATTPRAVIDIGNGLEHAPSASDAIRAIAMLMAVTGHLDRPGTNLFVPAPRAAPRGVALKERYDKDLIDKLVGPEFPSIFQPFLEGPSSAYYRILESVVTEHPYPIRAIIAPGTQPSVSTRGTKTVLAALQKLDFFVTVDVARTAEMNFADVVVPVATSYESGHPYHMAPGWLMATNRVIEPLGEYKSTFQFFLELADAMGYGNDFWGGDIDAAMDDLLEPLDLSMAELMSKPHGIAGKPGPPTYEKYQQTFSRLSPAIGHAPFLPQGKIALYNTTFEAAGFNPLPAWREPPESLTATPELADTYPLILSDYHTSKSFSASWQRNVPHLREIEPEPILHIHPDTATERGIQENDWIRVSSLHGFMKVRARLYHGIRPDTVMVLHGWWQGCKELGLDDYPLADGGANVNVMYSVDQEKAYDPLITAMSSQTLVQVERWEDR